MGGGGGGVYNFSLDLNHTDHNNNRAFVRTILPWRFPVYLEAKKPINRKHINIFLTALVGQSSQGRTPTRPRDKRDKITTLLWNSTEKGRFVPGMGPILSRGGVPFVPRTVPVCPETVPPKMFMFIVFFFFP